MLIKAYASLKFWWILRKIEELCTIISHFLQFVVASTGCIIIAMNMKNFPNTYMLLKVDRFE